MLNFNFFFQEFFPCFYVKKKIIHYYKESLTEDERQFLLKKLHRERPNFLNVLKTINLICLIFIAFITILMLVIYWVKPEETTIIKEDNPLTLGKIFAISFWTYFSVATLINLAFWLRYRNTIGRIKSDIDSNEKIIEQTKILNKRFMPQNQAYYFYIDSPNRYTIQVDENTYRMLEIGDELNLEYSEKSKIDFGYF